MGCRVTSQGTSQKQSSRDRTRPLTHGPPQQTPPFEIHDLAGILRAAAAENGASQRVADRGMLSRLIKPARSYLSCAWIDNLVVFVVLLSTDLRDMNRLHGLKRFRGAGADRAHAWPRRVEGVTQVSAK